MSVIPASTSARSGASMTTPSRVGGDRMWVLLMLVVELLLAGGAALFWATGHDRWGFAVVGLICAGLTHVPFLLPRQPFLSMWGLVSLAVTIGAGIRGLIIAVGYPTPYFVSDFFTRGRTFSSLFFASAITILSVGALVAGYLATQVGKDTRTGSGKTRSWALRASHVSEPLVVALAGVYALIGLYGTLTYTRRIGGLGVSIADRRTTINASGAAFESYGQFEYLAQAGTIGAVLLLAYWLTTRERLGPLRTGVLVLVFVNAFSINWVTTSRADLLYVTLGVLFLIAFVRHRVKVVPVVLSAVIVLSGIGALSAARKETSVSGSFLITYGLNSGLLVRNGYDLGKTLLVTQAVPERLPYQNGATIARYIISPIPRSLWPDKPIVSPGPIIGRTLYGQTRSGVPPGMTGELVWNFGPWLAVVFSALVGFALGRLDRWSRPRNRDDLTRMLFYALVVLTLGKAVVGVAIGQSLAAAGQTLVLLVPLYAVGALSTRRERRLDTDAVRRTRVRGALRRSVPVDGPAL